jgi:transcriptional regulator with XRE-family HTH domain
MPGAGQVAVEGTDGDRGVTSVDQAREALGARLRQLRRSTSLTGRQFAERLSWPASKISKLETGRQAPSEADIKAWVTATDAGERDAAALLTMLNTLVSAQAAWRRQLRGDVHRHQASWADAKREAALLRVFEPALVPSVLQTADYARRRIAQARTVCGIRCDIEDAVRACLISQDMLYDSSKRFHFVLTEAVLRYRMCSPDVMLPQLDRLVAASTLPNVRLGIIVFDSSYVIAPGHGFCVFDDEKVLVETFSTELTLTRPQEIDLYAKVFGAMAAASCYDGDARAILTKVMDDLRAKSPDGTTKTVVAGGSGCS